MARFARISDGIVAEIILLPDGLSPASAFHPDVAAEMRPCGEEVAEGWTFAGSGFAAPVAPPQLTGEALDALKTSLRTAIDAEAERERLRYITAGAGQAMTYARKTEEAKAASADATPTAEAYPLLAASVGIDGADIAAVAAVVLAMDAQWSVIGAAIEMARLSAKKTVTEAADEATARSAAVVTWPA
ncbi:MAG TPA: hypothetical protein VNX29_04555 [Kaistia sp.]|nr:hypothetical protein [Kaistia sp.]